MQARYIMTTEGGFKLTQPTPTLHSLYVDPANPSLSPEEVRQARYKEELSEVSTYAAILRSESVAKGEGEPRAVKAWEFKGHTVAMPTITTLDEGKEWLKQEGLTCRPSDEDSDTGLHVMCRRICQRYAWELRVTQKERWATIATDASANVVEELFATFYAPESTCLVRGEGATKTRFAWWMERSEGNGFPIGAMVATICRNEVRNELNRSGVSYNRTDGLDLAESVECGQVAMEQKAEFSLFIEGLSKDALAEETRNASIQRPQGLKETTVRQDIFKLYKLMLFNADIESSVKTNGTTGNANRDVICQSLNWTRRYHRTIMTELQIKLAYWEKPESEAKATEVRLRAALARNNA